MRLRFFLFLAVVCATTWTAQAQVTLSVALRSPTPPAIDEWRRDPTIVRVTLVNTSPTEFRNIRLSFFIRNAETGAIVVRTKDNDSHMPRFTLGASSVLMLNGPDIINQAAIDVDASLRDRTLTTGMLPEGTYEYCVDVLATDGRSLSNTGPACTIFRIFIPDPPELIYPVSESIGSNPYPVFRWSPVVLPGTALRYRIVVAAILEGQTPRDAIERGGASTTLIDREVPASTYAYQASDRPFSDFTSRGTTRFAWQIQALDATGRPATRNNGKSPIGEFTTGTGSSGSGSMTLQPYYPRDNDTLPWQPPHIIVRWGDYSDDITRMEYTLIVRNSTGGEAGRNSRTLNWPSGVMEGQGVFSVERARLIIVNFTDACALPSWMQSLPRGQRYSWTVEARFTRRDGSTTSLTSRSSSFVMGLRQPENRGPADNAVLTSGSDVTLRWVAPPPQELNFQPTDILTRRRTSDCMQFTPAFERMRVEVSRFDDFRTTVAVDSASLPASGNYVTGDAATELFAERSHTLGVLRDTGLYYWRVLYRTDAGTSYLTGPTWRFRIGSDTDDGTVTASECIRLLPASPEPGGRWTAGNQPRFSVLARPLLRTSSIRGGRLQVWEMNAAGEDSNAVMRRTPVFDQTFTGNAENSIRARSAMGGGTVLPLDISFVNESGSAHSFTVQAGRNYLWKFTLQFNGSSIRSDGTPCSASERTTRAAVFSVPDSGAACPDVCSTPAPADRTPASRTFAIGDSVRIGRFSMTLTRVTGSASALGGEGVVRIPFLNSAGINVEFSNLRVNSAGQVYEGEARAKQEPVSPLSADDANRLAGITGLSDAQISSIQTLASQAERLVSGLAGGRPMSLPIGFDNIIEGERMVVAVVGMVFRPTDARLNASASVTLPICGPGAGLGLMARDICFHPNGFGGDGRVTLCLAVDHGYREADTWSFLFKAPTERDSGTCVMFDCRGFQWLRIHADVEFPRTWMTKAPPATDTGLVKATFMTTIRRTGDFIVSATMNPFAPAGAPDFHMAVQDIVLDLSEAENYPAMVYPNGYTGDRTARWKGFYIGRIAVKLPDELRTFDSASPPRVELANVLIDRTGFSLDARAVNIIQYPRGNFGEWGASIDTFGITFLHSSLRAGYLRGRFQIPISDSALYYSATLAQSTSASASGLEFSFTIVPRDTINARLWVAQLSLNPTSIIELRASGSGVRASATLSGGFSLTGDAGGIPGLNFRGITFENVRIMTDAPYFDRGRWAFASPQHGAAGFPVSISDLGIVTGTRDRGIGAGLQFTLSVNLQSGDNGISGGTTLSAWGVMPTGSSPMRFEFDGIDVDSIGVRADMGAVVIAGGVKLYRRDPVFGSGFRGGVTANFLQQVEVQATVQFGSVDDYRYWYVDARALISAGIPIFSGVGIYGFGGGAWYHMRREAISASAEAGMLAGGGSTSPDTSTSTPGVTNSGYRFVPDRNTEFGFRAMVTLGTHPSPDAFNADVAFEMEFLRGGGVGRISILGAAYFIASPSNRSQAKVTATADLTYNFPERTFNGQFDVRINATPLTGGGRIVMHFSPRTWFIKAGEPPRDRRISVSLASWININTYLMVGKDLPHAMSLPAEIEEFLGPLPPVCMPQIANADGFAFGAEANFDTGRLQFLIFYARLALTLGFDVALLNMGPAARCQGSGGPMGINGWYAMGQLYASIRGSVGLYVDLWFVSGEFEILGVRAAAALRAGLPNPTWLTGAVAGSYSLLGGAINGYCRFEFKMGDECYPITENPLAQLDIVSDIQPPDGSRDIPFDVEPQAAFNFRLNRPFELTDYDSRGNTRVRTFRIKVRQFTIADDAGRTQSSSWRATADSVQAILTPGRPLAGEMWYRASVTAYGEEYNTGRRLWEAARRNDGSAIDQMVATRFRTAQPPDTIIPSNIASAYPRDRQRFFLQDECPDGSISLHASQEYLFTPGSGTTRYTYHARFLPLPSGTPPVEVPVEYRGSGRSGYIRYTMPTLPNNTLYALQIIRRAVRQSDMPELNENVRRQIASTLPTLRYGTINSSQTLQSMLRTYQSGLNTMVQSQRRVTGFDIGRRTSSNEDLLLVYFFRTSQYNTLRSKIAALSPTQTRVVPPFGTLELLYPRFTGPELFDTWDMEGATYQYHGTNYTIPPLVQVDAGQRLDRWHTSFTNPWIYDVIPKLEEYTGRRMATTTQFYRAGVRGNLLHYNSGARSPVYDSEIAAVPGLKIGTMLNQRSPFLSPLLPTYTPYIEFSFEHGIVVPLDFTTVRNEVSRLLACCSGEFMRAEDERRFRLVRSKTYEVLYRGSYRMWFRYNMCTDPDTPPTRYEKQFTY